MLCIQKGYAVDSVWLLTWNIFFNKSLKQLVNVVSHNRTPTAVFEFLKVYQACIESSLVQHRRYAAFNGG